MKTVIIGIVACWAGFIAGYYTNHKVDKSDELEVLEYLVQIQQNTIHQADAVMYNNNLIDYDDSEDMQKYLEMADECDFYYEMLK